MKRTEDHITAADLFARVADILNLPDGTPANRLMHETLVLCCQEALRKKKKEYSANNTTSGLPTW